MQITKKSDINKLFVTAVVASLNLYLLVVSSLFSFSAV